MNKTSLSNLSLDELTDLLKSWGVPPFRATQVWRWMYHSGAESFEAMSDLPVALRQRLAERTTLSTLVSVDEIKSRSGETTKVLFRLTDAETVEAVDMMQAEHHTVCVSTQVGCPVACPFCATGRQIFKRNMGAGEIVEQVTFFARSAPERPVTNVVFMGMGEPLINYNATVKAVRTLNSPQGFNLGARHMTISTAGLVPGIKRLAKEGLQIGLAVSLHAPTNALRNSLVPLNVRYPVEELIGACRDYYAFTGRRVTFEYALFRGINDSLRQASQLAKLLAGTNSHVNIIPANKTHGSPFQPTPLQQVKAFREELEHSGIAATVRRSLGSDIQAGCGQLKGRDLCEP